MFDETSDRACIGMSQQCNIAIKVSKHLPSTSAVVSSQISYKEFAGCVGAQVMLEHILKSFYIHMKAQHTVGDVWMQHRSLILWVTYNSQAEVVFLTQAMFPTTFQCKRNKESNDGHHLPGAAFFF